METAPQIGTHNACASGKTTGEGNRIRFPKQIQGDARVAEHAVGMTENCAVFRAERLCNFIQRKQLLLVQPLRLLYALHFVFWQRRCTEICLQIAVHFPAQKRMQICGQFSAILVIRPDGKTLTKL